ncbi:hypothetical protein HDU96_000223 [Phlyctochytrium bullatum]|nr:hypothetical protein HDU96_000223 [Phlyctochytrium bullatum]
MSTVKNLKARAAAAKTPAKPDYPALVYAALVAAGGVAGYASKGSTMSLYVGVAFGALIFREARQLGKDPSAY